MHTFYEPHGFLNDVAFHPSGTCIGGGCTDASVKIWDIRTRKLIQHYASNSFFFVIIKKRKKIIDLI
jgi:centriolar protein POC1